MLDVSIHTTATAAFGPDPRHEIARILRALADRIDNLPASHFHIGLRDVNGNTVGHATLDHEETAFEV